MFSAIEQNVIASDFQPLFHWHFIVYLWNIGTHTQREFGILPLLQGLKHPFVLSAACLFIHTTHVKLFIKCQNEKWGKPCVGENGGRVNHSFILPSGPHFLSFSLSVMTWCDTHTLAGCLSNEGVLTFRCFPSQLAHQNHTRNQTQIGHRREDFNQTLSCTWELKVVITCAGFVSFRAQREQSSSWWQYRREQRRRETSETHEMWTTCLFCPCCGSSL